jgi:FMN phosphatase YigB (HAD superfamily)
MAFRCVLLDFDGTFTLAEEEGAPFVQVYKPALAKRLGRDIEAEWQRAESEIRQHPAEHGWLFDGKLVAPANADPYIRCTTLGRMLMERLDFADVAERDRVLGELYYESYPHSATVFRTGAREVLEALMSRVPSVYVVTNSDTNAVAAKIDRLLHGAPKKPSVRGNAKKAYIVGPEPNDERFQALPERQTLAGLARPIYVRRGRYYEVLRQIWQESSTGPEDTLMVGDIYELDLALPYHLGAGIHLVTGEPTPDYERDFVTNDKRGAVSADLESILSRL